MRCLLLLLSSAAFASAIICPEFWSEGVFTGSCLSPLLNGGQKVEYRVARATCAHFYNAYMFDVENAFINNALQTVGAGYDNIWLGLTCLTNETSSCLWDSGRQMTGADFNNFAAGGLDVSKGACVYMSVSSGKWYSAPCSFSAIAVAACQYTPHINVPYCVGGDGFPTGDYFQGNCYKAVYRVDENDAEKECIVEHPTSHLASIHSPGENSFIRDLAVNNTDVEYALIGLKSSGSPKTWIDGTPMDYTNYDSDGGQGCAWMFVANGTTKRGKWQDTNCIKRGNAANGICKWKYEPDTTQCPEIDCSKPVMLSGTGLACSPGYPLASPPTQCTYIVTEQYNHWTGFYFQHILLDSKSKIEIYRITDPDGYPETTFTNVTTTTREYVGVAEKFMARMVFTTNSTFMNAFKFNYGTV